MMKKPILSMLWLLTISLLPVATLWANDLAAIQACLANWGEHPFDTHNPKFRILGSQVKVFGIGGNINETQKTDTPELVLIKSNVSVMTKSRMNLLNPNGWYCLQGKVNVMAKSIITIDCQAHLATSSPGTTVLGSSNNQEGVTVLGKAEIHRVNCR
jgi:hypothetical protein